MGLFWEFVIGGAVIALMSYLTQHVSPRFAAILYAFPVQILIVSILVYRGSGTSKVQGLLDESLFTIVFYIVFLVCFALLLRHYGFWFSLLVSLGVLMVGLVAYVFFRG